METTTERTTCARCEERTRSALHPCPNLPEDWEWRENIYPVTSDDKDWCAQCNATIVHGVEFATISASFSLCAQCFLRGLLKLGEAARTEKETIR